MLVSVAAGDLLALAGSLQRQTDVVRLCSAPAHSRPQAVCVALLRVGGLLSTEPWNMVVYWGSFQLDVGGHVHVGYMDVHVPMGACASMSVRGRIDPLCLACRIGSAITY